MRIKLICLILPVLLIASCNKKDSPAVENQEIQSIIPGLWLASFSDADNWTTYEFTETNRVNVKQAENGNYDSGTGFYFIDNNILTGSYLTDRGKTVYIDWSIESASIFEINYKLYNDNTYLGNSAIYRIISETRIETGDTEYLDFRAICGSDKVSDLTSLNNSIAIVDPTTGGITGVSEGATFITFKTPGGYVAIQIEIVDEISIFAESIVGTWIYDNPVEKEWQRSKFFADGYVYIEWSSGIYDLDESGDGYYTIHDNNRVVFTVTTPYGLTINQEWVSEDINSFIWTYNAVSDNIPVGKYTAQRLLASINLDVLETVEPDYKNLLGKYCEIKGFLSHDTKIATVDGITGDITGVSPGRTYVNVNTSYGAGVVEVNVE